jgi:peptidoglycan hydrolase-like protein with peptidoglycan-binding domain
MPDITNSVGEAGTNKVHDVALVQAMLRVVKNAKGQPYITSYDGIYGGQTRAAIIKFQTDQKVGAAKAVAGLDKLGLVTAGGPTITKLNALLPAVYKDIRIIENTKTVYWPGAATDAQKHQDSINNDPQLETAFRAKVAQLVQLMHTRHKIVLSLTPTGGLRTFQKQYDLVTQPNPPTKAGPGESNHNFGMAVDIGFKGFKWMHSDGQEKVDDWWLNQLAKASSAKAQELWQARDKIAFQELHMHPSALKGDLIHIQNFSDANTSMRRSLADLMDRVGKMRWQHANNQYQTDLGLGGNFSPVGTATQIWAKNAQVSKVELANALSQAQNKQVKASDIAADQLTNIKLQLRGEMETAETNASQWKPVP